MGGASLVALALTAFLLLAGLLAVDVGALAAARAGAQTAADMAALAALTPGGGPAAATAADIASANGAELVGCDCSAMEAVVTVRRRVVLVPTGLSVGVTARARAVLAWPAPRARRRHRREAGAGL
jgi:secretion/DNA translocation related TadE-like protein